MSEPDFKTQPWTHQLREFDASGEAPARALLWQMRTGKTKLIVDTACHLYRQGLIDGLVVFAPNGVHDNWLRRELPAHAWDSVAWRGQVWRAGVSGASRATSAATKAQQEAYRAWHQEFAEALKDDIALMVVTFNSESVTRPDVKALIGKMLKARRLMVVWDESSDYRTPGSKRAKMMRALARKVPYRRILDGTVSENSPLHVWSQYELLDEAALGFKTFSAFRQRYGVYEIVRAGGRQFPKLTGYQRLEELRASMAKWSSVVRREDCSDLPDVVAEERVIEMTEEQQRVYREVRKGLLNLGDVDVVVGQNKLLKLQQVGSGFLNDEAGEAHIIPGPQPRLDAVSDEVMLASGKVIVWCQFQKDIDLVAQRLRSDGHGVVEYHGRVKQADRVDARAQFADGASDDIKVFVGQPQAGGRGLELSAAGTIIWYSHTFDAIVRQQASERATKMAGRNVRMVDFVASGTDRYVRDTVERKVSIADDLAGRGLQAVLRELEDGA